MAQSPNSKLARSVLPEPLYRALVHVFEQGISGCMLVGGTALAGYYAGHRRSDDLDLFVRDADAHKATTLAVQTLQDLGASRTDLQHSLQFYSGSYGLSGHDFTVQAVLDANGFAVGNAMNWMLPMSVLVLPLIVMQFFQARSGDLEVVLTWPMAVRILIYLTLGFMFVLLGEDGGQPFIYFQF